MTTVQVLKLISNCPDMYNIIWEDLHYADRSIKEVAALFIRASTLVDGLRKNYP